MNQRSLVEKTYSPYTQAIIVIAAVLILMLIAKVLKWTGIMSLEDTFPWTIAAAFILFFAIFNSIISLTSADIDKYWKQSILSFIGLAVISGGLAMAFSNFSLEKAGPYKNLYMVFTFGYLVFISIIGFMKRIVDFAQNEEWQKPRRRPGRNR